MEKDFERCCHFLATMMEKYGAKVLKEIEVLRNIQPETLVVDTENRNNRLIAYLKKCNSLGSSCAPCCAGMYET